MGGYGVREAGLCSSPPWEHISVGLCPAATGEGWGSPFIHPSAAEVKAGRRFGAAHSWFCSQEKRGALIPPSVVQAQAELVQATSALLLLSHRRVSQ